MASLVRLDSGPSSVSPKDWSFSQYQQDARTPVVNEKGGLNPRAPLTLLIGLLIVGVQTAESYGIHVVPYKRMQNYFTKIDMRSAVQDNMAFKISFGAMFALSAFAEF
ncbi:hypothetical protein D0869_14336 [Hortaea werneckii]|uniref:Uncharacterized protein n=1 Tax=Hortaea werneckii TaxID=91943 RepID=A0A3M6W2D7_HORWE|nr:hypothetical protein D0869_14336 [Hortaea werneckii]RMY10036.1 hypothetical protein D0868_03922 [Hortaea werneckii]